MTPKNEVVSLLLSTTIPLFFSMTWIVISGLSFKGALAKWESSWFVYVVITAIFSLFVFGVGQMMNTPENSTFSLESKIAFVLLKLTLLLAIVRLVLGRKSLSHRLKYVSVLLAIAAGMSGVSLIMVLRAP